MPRCGLHGCTLLVYPVLSKMNACLTETIILACESNSEFEYDEFVQLKTDEMHLIIFVK
jgi:predicted amino acid dehydrogenase